MARSEQPLPSTDLGARRRNVLRVGAVLVIVLLGGLAVFGLVGRSWIAHGIVDAPSAGKTFSAVDDARAHLPPGAAHLRIELAPSAAAPISMSMWLVEPAAPARGTVLVLHGVRSDKAWLAGLGRQIASEGYRAILPDLRGHGGSTGDYLTYGVHDANDLVALLDELERRGRSSGPVGVVGFSYGGATGIQLAAVDSRIRAVVAIAPFGSLRTVVPDYVEAYLPLLGRLVPDSFVQGAVDHAGSLGRFDPDAASPIRAIARTRARVLLIHGAQDRHIPAQHSRAIHAVAPHHSELIVLEREDHDSIASDRTRTIATHGMAWLRRWLDAAPPG